MIKALCGCVFSVVAFGYPAMADSVESPVVGVWRVIGWQGQDASGQTMKYYGEHPGGYYLFSKDGHFIFLIMGEGRSAPASVPTTQEEAAKLYATLSAFDGIYKVTDDNKFVVHVQDAWNQAWTGTDQSRNFAISGDILRVAFTTKNPVTGNDMAVTTTSQRVE